MIGAAKNEIFDSTAIDACFLERTSFFLTTEKIIMERDVCKDLNKIPEGKNLRSNCGNYTNFEEL
jgi:hypothetical protein